MFLACDKGLTQLTENLFCPLGLTPLPLQILASGQSLSSTSVPGHWLCSSPPETGRPESRSKQARKRLWIETILLPFTSPSREVSGCREAKGKQREHAVHSDHSLRMTERKQEIKYDGFNQSAAVCFTPTFLFSYLHTLLCHTAKFHCSTDWKAKQTIETQCQLFNESKIPTEQHRDPNTST